MEEHEDQLDKIFGLLEPQNDDPAVVKLAQLMASDKWEKIEPHRQREVLAKLTEQQRARLQELVGEIKKNAWRNL